MLITKRNPSQKNLSLRDSESPRKLLLFHGLTQRCFKFYSSSSPQDTELTFVFAGCSRSSGPASLSSPPPARPSLGARLSCRGVALLLTRADQALLLGQEWVDRKHRCCLHLIAMTQHVACGQQKVVGESERVTVARHFLSLEKFSTACWRNS